MPAQALYLKYRPQTFDDVQGQDHVTRTLKNALALGRIAHAYLFTGTRGTGKTSTARILAKAVNCTSSDKEHPCNECAICRAINQERLLDLIEIDAASNNGVEHIRELRDKIDFRPSEARYKVYIVDEAHMLSGAAFNALLKTLEEPPPHVIFILATTEVNKIPATIASRCQRFDFRRATLQELVGQLGHIAEQEGLSLEPAALELVARQANGSFRDGTSLLDQLTAYSGDTITLAHVQTLLGAASHETIHTIVRAIVERNVAQGIAAINEAVDAGADPRQVARDVVEYLRGIMLLAVRGDAALNIGSETRAEMSALAGQLGSERALAAIRLFSQAGFELRSSANSTLPLEMALVESALETHAPVAVQPSPTVVAAPPRAAPSRPTAEAPAPAAPPKSAPTPAPAPAASRPAASRGKKADAPPPAPVGPVAETVTLEVMQAHWNTLLSRLHLVNKTTDAFLKDAHPVKVVEDTVTIGFLFPAHKDRIDQDKQHKPLIEKTLSDMFGRPVRIKCTVSPKKAKLMAAEDDPMIRAAMNLGGVVKDILNEEE